MITENFDPTETQVIFFHGLESNSKSEKAAYLKSKYNAYCPEMDYNNPHLFNDMYDVVMSRRPRLLIGSSMGGWFAYCLSTLTGTRTLLLNPALQGRSMEPKGVHLGKIPSNHVVVLGKGDEVIDPQLTKSWIRKNGIGDFTYHMENIGHRTPNSIMVKYLDEAINEEWSTESPGNFSSPVVFETIATDLKQNFLASRPHPGNLTVEDIDRVKKETLTRNEDDIKRILSVKESPVDEFYTWFSIRGYKVNYKELRNIWENPVLIKLTDDLKDHYKRPRPYWLDSSIVPVEGTETSSWSYPSGHSMGAYLIAFEMSKKYPYISDSILDVAERIANTRAKTGVHFHSDIEAGKEIAKMISEKI